MRGRLALRAKVVGRGHEAATKVIEPDAIDDHARGQRIVRVADPLRQLQPATALGDFLAAEQVDVFPRNRFAHVGGIASAVQFFFDHFSLGRPVGVFDFNFLRQPIGQLVFRSLQRGQLQLRSGDDRKEVALFVNQFPSDSVAERMAILHEATDANATFDRARPANPHRAIRRRVNKKSPRR